MRGKRRFVCGPFSERCRSGASRVLVFMDQNKAHPKPDRKFKRPVHRIMHVVAIVAFQLATCKGSKIIDQV